MPAWPGVGGGVFVALEIVSLNSSFMSLHTSVLFVSFGAGVWVFAAGAVAALGSAFLLRRTRTGVHYTTPPVPEQQRGNNVDTVVEDGTGERAQSSEASEGPADSVRQSAATRVPAFSAVDEIKKLAELRDSGLVNETEFEAKKTELLARI